MWQIGSGFNEFNKKDGLIRVFRWGYPGKNRRIDLVYILNWDIDTKKQSKPIQKQLFVSLTEEEQKIYDYLVNKENELMEFKEWNSSDVLQLNKYGIPQTFLDSKTLIPDIFLVPLLAFDKYGNRLGYGSGYYDKYFNMLNKTKKKFRTIGIGFSFQKKDRLKILKTDFCLDAVFTEKGFLNIQ